LTQHFHHNFDTGIEDSSHDSAQYDQLSHEYRFLEEDVIERDSKNPLLSMILCTYISDCIHPVEDLSTMTSLVWSGVGREDDFSHFGE